MPVSDITISGASDDLIEIEGNAPGCDEYNVPDGHGSFVVTCEGGRAVRVVVTFGRGGVWAVSLAPIDDGFPMAHVHVDGGEDDRSAYVRIADVVNVVREADAL